MTVEGMLYRMRVGCPWRDLPKAFGCWSAIYKRFNAWSASGKWLSIFKTLVVEPDWEWVFIDGSYAKAHQHSAGAASDDREGIGRSRAGNTSKIHLAVDAQGLPVEFAITGGEINDCTAAPALIAKLPGAGAIIADKGYDSESRSNPREATWSFRESGTRLKETLIWIGACIAIGIWWKTPLLA